MKNIRYLILFFIGLLIIFLETFFTNFIGHYVSVNFLMIYIVFISLYIDKNNSLILAGILGILSDVVSGGIVGVTAILFLVISYFISVIEKSIFKDKIGIICLLVFVISIFYSIINAVFSAIFFIPTPIIIAAVKSLIIIPVANTIFAYIGYRIFGKKLKKLREE